MTGRAGVKKPAGAEDQTDNEDLALDEPALEGLTLEGLTLEGMPPENAIFVDVPAGTL